MLATSHITKVLKFWHGWAIEMEATQKYAHIFNAAKKSGFKYELKITQTPNLSIGIVLEVYRSDDKIALKQQAKKLQAKPWNY